MYAGKYACCDEQGPKTADTAFLLQGTEPH
jgi:hypothetical protein